jgi:hypothetical protein
MESGGKVDDSPYTSHEDVSWGISGFQRGLKRGTCTGRIHETGSIYYPLACECGTVLSSLQFSAVLGAGSCAKFQPNEGGKERMKMAEEIAKERGIELSEIDPEELLPEPDPCYRAAMMY